MRTHQEALAALRALSERLPAVDASAPLPRNGTASKIDLQAVADDAAHDHYFRIWRAAAPDGAVFVRAVLSASALFHAEMAAAYAPAEAERFAAVGAGLAALLAHIAGIRLAPLQPSAAEPPATYTAVDPMQRWMQGHQIFAVLTQGIVLALLDFEAAVPMERQRARVALALAADLLMASAAAFRFTAHFAPRAYRDVVRPSMMAVRVGAGFSGLLSVDHRELVIVLTRLRPMLALARRRFAAERTLLTRALNHVYDNHKYVCAQFDGANKPSLRCPSASPLPGVEQLERYQCARVALLRAGTAVEDPLII
jgi:hypothetical protein